MTSDGSNCKARYWCRGVACVLVCSLWLWTLDWKGLCSIWREKSLSLILQLLTRSVVFEGMWLVSLAMWHVTLD